MDRNEFILDCISRGLSVFQTQKVLAEEGYRILYPRYFTDAVAMYILYHPERRVENEMLILRFLEK